MSELKIRGTNRPAAVLFEHQQFPHAHMLTATIDDETFHGRGVQDKSDTFGQIGTRPTFFTIYGNETAILQGSGGSTLICHFAYDSPSSGPYGGGIGKCDHTNGMTIDLIF